MKKRTKTPERRSDYTIEGLSRLLKKDRRTIGRIVADISPARLHGRRKFYRLEDVQAELRQRLKKAGGKLQEQKLIEEIRKLRIANDERESKIVPKSMVAAAITRTMSALVRVLEQKLMNEYPVAVAGLDVPQARIFGRRLFDDCVEHVKQLESEFAECGAYPDAG